MSDQNIIYEIKNLMAEGLHAKSMRAGSDYAIEKLREAVTLSEQIENTIWSNVPNYDCRIYSYATPLHITN